MTIREWMLQIICCPWLISMHQQLNTLRKVKTKLSLVQYQGRLIVQLHLALQSQQPCLVLRPHLSSVQHPNAVGTNTLQPTMRWLFSDTFFKCVYHCCRASQQSIICLPSCPFKFYSLDWILHDYRASLSVQIHLRKLQCCWNRERNSTAMAIFKWFSIYQIR